MYRCADCLEAFSEDYEMIEMRTKTGLIVPICDSCYSFTEHQELHPLSLFVDPDVLEEEE